MSDIEIALTEACTNVLDHALDHDEYEVIARVLDDLCAIDVIDRGGGFEADKLGNANAEMTAENGRGIQLIRALVDTVHFTPGSAQHTVVHFEKKLQLHDDAPLRRLIRRDFSGSTSIAEVEKALSDRENLDDIDTASLAAKDGVSRQ
jgi:hypothetical protein